MDKIIEAINNWSERQKGVHTVLRTKKRFNEGIRLVIEQHNKIHFKEVSNVQSDTLLDSLWNITTEEEFYTMPSKTNKNIEHKRTVAHHIWHITRIEDLVANVIIGECEPIFNEDWMKKLNITITDTGNAMTNEEILSFSKNINLLMLKEYRNAVGKRTNSIIQKLQYEDLKKRASNESLLKIMELGGLTKEKKSYWLKDFWGSKTYAGLLLLPITRHHMMHIKDWLYFKVDNTSVHE